MTITMDNIKLRDFVTPGEVASFINKVTGKKYRTAAPVKEILFRSNLGIIFTCEDGIEVNLTF